ncbi:hypothetical protein BDQ17DRAFT_1366607 [Cyathus striatus]|nr:hypothetical protein BDQ17DRAFT_1366607 [Cyathus striatus]
MLPLAGIFGLILGQSIITAVTACPPVTTGNYSVVSSGMKAQLQGQRQKGRPKLPVFSNGSFIAQELGNQWTIVETDGWLYQFIIPNLGSPLTSIGRMGDGIMADFSDGKDPTMFAIACAGNNEYVVDLVWTNEYDTIPPVSPLYSTVKLRPSNGSPSQLYSLMSVLIQL